MRILNIASTVIAAIDTTVTQGYIGGGGLACYWSNSTISNPPRLCTTDLMYSDRETQKPPYGEACAGEPLLNFLSKCPMRGIVHVLETTIYHDFQYTPECWRLQCSILDQYLRCVRVIFNKSDMFNSTDYQAAALLLLSECAIRGYDADVAVGKLHSHALITAPSAAAFVIIGCLVGIFAIALLGS